MRLMRVQGHSMAPTLTEGELVFVRASHTASLRRGDIVAVRPAALGGQALVKRLVGLPYQRVELEGRQWQLGAGQFFLLGDQPNHSVDSRVLGPVTHEELIGPVVVRVWPWKVLSRSNNPGGADG